MISFPCHCGWQLEVPEELAGGEIQCPNCFKLNDVPTLNDLTNLRSDGTFELKDNDQDRKSTQSSAGRPTPAVAAATFAIPVAGSSFYDLQPNEGLVTAASSPSLRENVHSIPLASDDSSLSVLPMVSADLVPLPLRRPRYDPETGQLIEELSIVADERPASPVLTSKPTLGYAAGRLLSDAPLRPIALELLMPINALVMAFVFAVHVGVELIGRSAASFTGVMTFFFLCLSAPLVAFILSHYAVVIEETGPEARDELPRPLRNVNFWEDFWVPLGRMLISLALTFAPLAIVLSGHWVPESWKSLVSLLSVSAGIIVLPAILITVIAGGTWLNLRPDRIWGVMRAGGADYAVTVLLTVVTTAIYLWVIFGLYLVPDATFYTHRWLRYLDHPAVTYASMILAIYFAHWVCWQMGMVYRRHHEQFPWVFQRHVPQNRPRPFIPDRS
ncbi:MAG: hypothetical protein IT448_05520 [Phycisphaerales bacterium]|nr:hypothetical protein [Phycisphaerales bacterium]